MSTTSRLVFGLLLFVAAPAWAQTDRVEAFITERMRAAKVPGMSVAIIRHGKVVKAEGYGLADVDRRIPVTPETVFKIGSVSKQIIAAAIMLLQQDGRLLVDDPVHKYLDGAPPAWRPITIRHLLTHTAGLVRESPAFDSRKRQPDADVLRATYALPLRFAPGEKWEYSNVGYFALADIIRSVTGRPWWEYVHARLFVPTGMASTTLTNTPPRTIAVAAGYTGNDNRRKAEEWLALRPSGAFLSSVLDLIRWDETISSNRLLMPQSEQLITTPVLLTDGTTAPYGFGVHVDMVRGRRRVWHGGGLPGFVAHYVKFPDDELTVIVLTNGDDVDLPSIAMGIADLFFDGAKP